MEGSCVLYNLKRKHVNNAMSKRVSDKVSSDHAQLLRNSSNNVLIRLTPADVIVYQFHDLLHLRYQP